MSATVDLWRWTGVSPGTKTLLTNLNTRANAEDSPTSNTANPVQIPVTGLNYSYWVCTRLAASTSPTTTIYNLRWYTTANNFGNGILCNCAEATGYVQATGTPGQTGNPLNTTNYPAAGLGAVEDAFTHQSTNVKSLNGTLNNPNTGDIGSFLVYQITVGNNALPGASGQNTFTWKYDES